MKDRSFSKLLIALIVVFAVALIACGVGVYLIVARPEKNPEKLHNQAIEALHIKHYAAAAKFFTEAIEESKGNSDRLKHSALLGELAAMYSSENKLALAQDALQKAVADYKEVMRTNAADTSTDTLEVQRECSVQMGNLANVLRDQGKLHEAEPLYKEAIAQNTSATDDVSVLEKLQNDYAQCLRKMGRAKDADAFEIEIESNSIAAGEWSNTHDHGILLFRDGKFAEADKVFAATQLVCTRLPRSFKSSVSLLWLAISSLSKGDSAVAEDDLKRAIELMKLSGEEKEHTWELADEWAYLAFAQTLNGRSHESELSYKRALLVDPQVGPHFSDLATAYQRLGKPDDEHRLYQWLRAKATKDGKNADLLNLVASHYFSLGSYAEAELLSQQALEICEKTKRPNSLEAASSLHSLAMNYKAQGKYELAAKLYKRELTILDHKGQAGSIQAAAALQELGQCYINTHSYSEAEPLLKRSLASLEKLRGGGSLEVAAASQDLAVDYQAMQKFSEAEPQFKRALVIFSSESGKNSAEVAHAAHQLAVDLQCLEKYAEAEQTFRQALAIFETDKRSDQIEMANCLCELATNSCMLKKYSEAEELNRRAMLIYAKRYGATCVNMIGPLFGLAQEYHGEGKYAEAEVNYKQALSLCEKNKTLLEKFALLNGLATNCRDQRKYSEAERLYQSALTLIEKLKGQ